MVFVGAVERLDQLERPDVDSISGLSPVICIDQRSGQPNPRSTVATTTEIHDYLRLLWARVGCTICRQCGKPVERESPEVVASELLQSPDEGVAEFLDLARVKPNTLGNTRMLLEL